MAEIHDAVLETVKSEAFATSLGKLSETDANEFAAMVMAIVNGKPIQQQPQPTGPRILSEQEFLALDDRQLKKLDKYDAYVQKKMEQSAQTQQSASMDAELAAASARLDEMRKQQTDQWTKRQDLREKLIQRYLK